MVSFRPEMLSVERAHLHQLLETELGVALDQMLESGRVNEKQDRSNRLFVSAKGRI